MEKSKIQIGKCKTKNNDKILIIFSILIFIYRYLEICDLVKLRNDGVSCVNQISQRIDSSDSNVIKLSLSLLEFLEVNCTKEISNSIGSKLLAQLASISSGRYGYDNSRLAQKLVEDLFNNYGSSNTALRDLYNQLKSKGYYESR
jgi:hypothetical protein